MEIVKECETNTIHSILTKVYGQKSTFLIRIDTYLITRFDLENLELCSMESRTRSMQIQLRVISGELSTAPGIKKEFPYIV